MFNARVCETNRVDVCFQTKHEDGKTSLGLGLYETTRPEVDKVNPKPKKWFEVPPIHGLRSSTCLFIHIFVFIAFCLDICNTIVYSICWHFDNCAKKFLEDFLLDSLNMVDYPMDN